MPYNSATHHRRSIRLKGYDYWQAGAYFITICCQDRKHRFGAIESGQMQLNDFGTIAHNEWNKLSERFSNFEVDVFQIMPNHMHGIIVLNVGGGGVGAGLARAPELNACTIPTPPPTIIGDIAGAYKSIVANACLQIFKSKYVGVGVNPAGVGVNPAPTIPLMGKLWQRNYYEHIIRDEKSYQVICSYIINNPDNWKDDKFFNQ